MAEDNGNDTHKAPIDDEDVEESSENGDENNDDNHTDEQEDIPRPALHRLESFEGANLSPDLLSILKKSGWSKPTDVQALCLPHTLSGRDVAGFAQTGTGKTGVFLITTSQRFLNEYSGENASKKQNTLDRKAAPFCVVIAPTRELALQIQGDSEHLLGDLGISSVAIFGGVDYEKQTKKLNEGVDIIIATPGRLIDFYQKQMIDLSLCRIFVCDEVDRMFDMGFIDDVEFFLNRLPDDVQKLIFSATTNPNVEELAFKYLDKPEYISVNPEKLTPEAIEQHAVICESATKLKVMVGLFREHKPSCAIIFTNTKITAEWLHYKLVNNGIEADLITGDLPQKKRIRLIERIKKGELKVLIATDVASRGLHIACVTHVYNFDLPDEPANYIHRVGRTARSGNKGNAYSLVCEDYGHNLMHINELLGPELALKSEWFDSSRVDFVDRAGNPFEGASYRKGTGFDRHEKRPGQKFEKQGRHGRGRDRVRDQGRDQGRDQRGDQKRSEAKPQKDRHDKPHYEDRARENHGQEDRGRDHKRRDERHDFRRDARQDHRQDRNRGQHGRDGRRDDRRDDRNNRVDSRFATNNPKPLFVDKKRRSSEEEVPNSLSGIVKRVWGLVFKKKN